VSRTSSDISVIAFPRRFWNRLKNGPAARRSRTPRNYFGSSIHITSTEGWIGEYQAAVLLGASIMPPFKILKANDRCTAPSLDLVAVEESNHQKARKNEAQVFTGLITSSNRGGLRNDGETRDEGRVRLSRDQNHRLI
jgi:hypothetical protein